MGSWEDLVSFLTSLAEEDRARFSRYAAMDLPGEPDALAATLRAYAEENPAATASDLLAFEKHCRAALYEYRGDRGEAARVCRRASRSWKPRGIRAPPSGSESVSGASPERLFDD